jgi:hypothetical protein
MASQCGGNKNKFRIFVCNFNEKRENNYLFFNVNDKCVYSMYNASVAVNKKCSLELHFMTMHEEYRSKYSNNRNT